MASFPASGLAGHRNVPTTVQFDALGHGAVECIYWDVLIGLSLAFGNVDDLAFGRDLGHLSNRKSWQLSIQHLPSNLLLFVDPIGLVWWYCLQALCASMPVCSWCLTGRYWLLLGQYVCAERTERQGGWRWWWSATTTTDTQWSSHIHKH